MPGATAAEPGLTDTFKETLQEQRWGCAASSETGMLLIQLPLTLLAATCTYK